MVTFSLKRADLAEVVSDGRVINLTNDPPGQRSIYIRPGDPERQLYRLSTFEKFPQFIPVNPFHLAAGGFYFTGYKDRVKCFSCAQIVENWSVGDDPMSSIWHKRECQFIRGIDISNVPIRGNYASTMPRNQTNSSLTTSPSTSRLPQQQQHQLSESSSIVNVSTIPQTASPSSITAETSRNSEAVPSHHSQHQPQEERPGDVVAMFPCLNPTNPHMRNDEARIQTFRDQSRAWPAHRIRATPEQISQAGLYYLGETDRVKCWYCNGGLQNWDRFDDPWFEHAKWFPTCEFVLQKKGTEFVMNVVERFPNLNRPPAINPVGPFAANLPQVVSGPSRISLRDERTPGAPQIIDPREERRTLERKVGEEMRKPSLVPEARLMGFGDEEIRDALIRRFEEHNTTFPSLASLIENIIAAQETNQANSVSSSEVPQDASSSSAAGSSNDSDYNQCERELRSLEQRRLCKMCRRVKATVVLLPCGHLAACPDCGQNLESCPVCKSIVRETIHSFIV